ncbi:MULTISPECIES: aspartate aminotransferase family protein [Cytobacillus]|uniref:Aspartate aminotransferase family protein n=1 Tax=Cytobacillus pseudoceanisediminis TaxID=3051614 RepID=A0ABZ2ZK10_9BACI|nr:aspartate aminotransferase family protein [Cytobacillus oceanisediminis]EFV75224.1 aminotransferase class-III [Bacillus sp. 2_A_57_CT2]MCM3403481.1 aspartate aminotransferase family protein [Cytobacillus oceanisediminis]MDK7667296.1 aspartate aminotransferase family protein [Cytobacillus oceanisediminis]QOK26638.1 aspartate aminotransferase family protein [Cytobacillus oceanisediminis]
MLATEQGKDLQKKDERYIWHAMRGSAPVSGNLIIKEAKGAWVVDIEGNKYLDGLSGLWCVNAGYGRKELAEAAYEQLLKMPYFPMAQSHIPAIKLAEKLNEWLGDDYVLFFSNSGSEANETAFKIARQYHQQKGDHGRYKFISRYRAYHGNSMGALAATGQAERKYKYEPLAPGFIHVNPPDVYRNPIDEHTLESAQEVDKVMTWELSQTVAAMIMEPIITGGGCLIPPQNYMKKVKEICEKHGALLICDEVICGFGRTGKPFGFMHYDVKPDIITMAKGITSAYLPLSATAVKREIYEAYSGNEQYDRLRHVNTFGGNPAACALALKNLEIFEDEKLIERSQFLGERLLKELEEVKDLPFVGDVRGKGLLIGIELVEDKESKKPASVEILNKVISACKERKLIIGKNGDTVAGYNNILQLAPPLSITEDDFTFIVKTLKESLRSI